jgi:serine/threonine protein kinase
VLVNGDGVSKLTDFGIAARSGDRPVPAGTLLYAAPEQMAGAAASPASDVYAAAATFYECLTGRPPFRGEDADLIRQHRLEPVPLEPVPESLRPLVVAGMAKDPAHRPTDATTFITELKTAASRAYGRDWQDRGRSHLGEAALLLAALWPSGPPPTVQGTTVRRLPLRRRVKPRPFSTAIAAGAAIAIVAAATVLATTRGSSHRPSTTDHPLTVRSVSLQPTPRSTAPVTSGSLSAPSPSPSASGQKSTPPGYDKYANPRYGFTALWPSSFRAQPPPEDGDGQAWASPDGRVMLSAYGANNVFNYSPGQDEAADARDVSVVYSNISGNVVTVSGYKNSGRTIVYQRDVVGPGAIDTLYWSYPANQKAQWDAAVTLTTLTFQPGDVTATH